MQHILIYFFTFLLSTNVITVKSYKTIIFSPQKSVINCEYEQSMIQQGLVNIKNVNPNILVELKYSTKDNFVGKDVYGCLEACFLQKKTAQMLSKAADLLTQENKNYKLLVYDGTRPASIQKILWESLKQYPPAKRETFVANPIKGSIHNYGCAVDLTLADEKGKPFDMGTKYDFFGELAYPAKETEMLKTGKLSILQVNNRKLLRKVMVKAGFSSIKYEWWHFNAFSRAMAKKTYAIVK
jgi:zinc D-Ala-D-Ala dipeptidase